MPVRATVLCIAAVWAVAGCRSDVTPPRLVDKTPARTPATLTLAPNQDTLPEYSGATVSPAPVFIVRDSSLNPIPGVPVTFSADTLGGVVTGDKQVTDSAGRVAPTSWTMGEALRAYSLTASTGALTATATVRVTSGRLTTLVATSGDKQQGGVGLVALTGPLVVALDATGRNVPHVGVTWSDGAVGRVRCSSTTNGVGVASLAPCQWRFGDNPGTDTLYATAGTTTATLTATVFEPPASLVFLSPAPNVTISTLDSASITARVELRLTNGQPAPGYSLDLRQSTGGAPTTVVTDASGIATATYNVLYLGRDSIGASSKIFPAVNSSVAFSVVGPITFVTISAGGAQTCGTTVDVVRALGYNVFCWGSNASGQLGDGTTVAQRLTPTLTPLSAVGPNEIDDVAVGRDHTCAPVSIANFYQIISFVPKTYCWGSNAKGQLGVAGSGSTNTPAPLNQQIGTLSAGVRHTCGVKYVLVLPVPPWAGVWCWGANRFGALGDGTTIDRSTPVLVDTTATGADIGSVAAGDGFTCAIQSGGRAFCWGRNTVGQLGDGTTTDRSTPVPTAGDIAFRPVDPLSGRGNQIVAGDTHACALTTTGAVYCWGSNASGQLGDGTTTSRSTPAPVAGGISFASISAGASHTCGLTSDGTAYCWGSNVNGQLGTGTQGSFAASPQLVAGGFHFRNIAAGQSHSCALVKAGTIPPDGSAYCWGLNSNGQLGDGTTTTRLTPTPVSSTVGGTP